MTQIAVVINPIAGGGLGKTTWDTLQPGLHAVFDEVIYGMSNHVDDLVSITEGLLESEPDFLLVIGGDGTLNQVLNGFIEKDQCVNTNTTLAYFNAGSGGDYARQFPAQNATEFLDRLAHNQAIQTNIGKITFAHQPVRYFINIASCGLSGQVVLDTEKSRWMKKLGGSVNYFVHSIMGLIKYKPSQVRILVDDAHYLDCSLLLMAVCNGQFFGGRMHVAPMAKINDGLLDMVLFHDFTKTDALIKFRKIYTGSHVLEKKVHYVQAKKVAIESLDNRRVEMEADGEYVGCLPAIFELLNQTVPLII